MSVTGRTSTQRWIPPETGVTALRTDDSFLEEDKSLGRLEGGTRRVGTSDSPVDQRLVGIVFQRQIIDAKVLSGEHCRIIGGRRNHAKATQIINR